MLIITLISGVIVTPPAVMLNGASGIWQVLGSVSIFITITYILTTLNSLKKRVIPYLKNAHSLYSIYLLRIKTATLF